MEKAVKEYKPNSPQDTITEIVDNLQWNLKVIIPPSKYPRLLLTEGHSVVGLLTEVTGTRILDFEAARYLLSSIS